MLFKLVKDYIEKETSYIIVCEKCKTINQDILQNMMRSANKAYNDMNKYRINNNVNIDIMVFSRDKVNEMFKNNIRRISIAQIEKEYSVFLFTKE